MTRKLICLAIIILVFVACNTQKDMIDKTVVKKLDIEK